MTTTARLLGLLDNVRAVLGARWYLRRAERTGARCRVWGRPWVRVGGTLVIGERLQLLSRPWRTDLTVAPGATLEIGDRVYINHGCSIGAASYIRIGSNCNLGTQVQLMDSDWHRLEPERRHERPEPRPIVLGENVWLGARVLVLSGVTIGDGSVVGAGSVVVSDIPPRSLAVGSPARVVREL